MPDIALVKRLDISIAGAGIGGLAAAGLLAEAGHRVTVHDQFAEPRPVGSGLVIQPVGLAVLGRLGLREAAVGLGNPLRRMVGHEADSGRQVLDVAYDRLDARTFGLAIHRASLHHLLLDAVAARGVEVVTGFRVAGREGTRLVAEDGRRSGPADLVVDACGARSALSPIRSRALPFGAVWATVAWPATTDLAPDTLSQRYRRADRMAGVMATGRLPGSEGPLATIFWSLPADGHASWLKHGRDAWLDEALALWPGFAPFGEQVANLEEMTMARYAHGTLARPFREGIVHIGDAAHRASPQLGQGANMALLDAAALAGALEAVPPGQAGAEYARRRRLHVLVYQAVSAAFTPQYQSASRVLPVLRDRVLFPASRVPPLPGLLTRLVCGTLVVPERD